LPFELIGEAGTGIVAATTFGTHGPTSISAFVQASGALTSREIASLRDVEHEAADVGLKFLVHSAMKELRKWPRSRAVDFGEVGFQHAERRFSDYGRLRLGGCPRHHLDSARTIMQ
jgi:hypothetical protein